MLQRRRVILNGTAMSALTMALSDLPPMDPFVHPAPPVLALGIFVAHMQISLEIFAPARSDPAAKMNGVLYW